MRVRRVYFNSACPVCRAGIANQRKRMNTTSTGCKIEWRDITEEPDALVHRGITIDDVRRKLYVEDEQGGLYVGAGAFTALWQETPGWRWLGRLLSVPGISVLARWAYNRFADRLYAWNPAKAVGDERGSGDWMEGHDAEQSDPTRSYGTMWQM